MDPSEEQIEQIAKFKAMVPRVMEIVHEYFPKPEGQLAALMSLLSVMAGLHLTRAGVEEMMGKLQEMCKAVQEEKEDLASLINLVGKMTGGG